MFSFRDQLDAADPEASRLATPRREAPRPERFRQERSGTRTTIAWRWFGFQFLFLALFCVVWDAFLVLWYTMATGPTMPLMMKLFPLLHVAAGIGLTYYTLAGFLNRTSVEIMPTRMCPSVT